MISILRIVKVKLQKKDSDNQALIKVKYFLVVKYFFFSSPDSRYSFIYALALASPQWRMPDRRIITAFWSSESFSTVHCYHAYKTMELHVLICLNTTKTGGIPCVTFAIILGDFGIRTQQS